MEEEHILKNRLKEIIGESKVIAALFYTFNFEPKFFENYVMPLLVPHEQFINNTITNNILWRKLYKDNLVPPITVYFDQDAKSTEYGPYLDYVLVPVNMPMIGKNKGNFHPKHSFILIENVDRTKELIVITGSNNITQGGWCENIECISEHIFINGKELPQELKRSIREFIEDVASEYIKNITKAEEYIIQFLNKMLHTKEREIYFYNTYQGSFQEFLETYVLIDTTITQLEIISPFFKKTPGLLKSIQEKNIQVSVQAPFKNEYCLLDPHVFEAYRAAKIKWYYPNNQSRNNHSKVYRFYGPEKVYTIIGSVNLTDPAWRGYEEKPKQIFNIETAVLHIETNGQPSHLFKKEIKSETLSFLPSPASKEEWHERIEIPDISFTINWVDKTLQWICKAKNSCTLHLSDSISYKLSKRQTENLEQIKNGKAILEGIARKPLLHVTEKVGSKTHNHYFYLNQIGFESRPLEFRFSATDIIDAWELLGSSDKNLSDWLVNRLELATDLLQDESGQILEDKSRNKSLLNEMARHFYGLVKLEAYLFDETILRKNNGLQAAHLNNLRYYLTCDNVDTLRSYLSDLEKLHEKDEIMDVYYWLLLSIIKANFYENKLQRQLIRKLYTDREDLNTIKATITSTQHELIKTINKVEKNLDLDKKKIKWALSILNGNYAGTE